ncbi:hypothetical protein [Lactobacillus crispatus]|uniref:hypothetical protein n=1 Tax=Lactobacillus crispatus TaxID=47770 RepID=UPI000AFDD1E1|nr:hypothetical protein [Lactobacillus crispatus]
MNISKTVLALYQTIIGEKQKRLIKTADAYLDINYGDKVYQIIDQVKERNIPILGIQQIKTILTQTTLFLAMIKLTRWWIKLMKSSITKINKIIFCILQQSLL